MVKKLIFLILLLMAVYSSPLLSQGKSVFSSDLSRYSEELKAFMGPNLNVQQLAILNNFLSKWDSSGFNQKDMVKISDISSQLSARLLRTTPHFLDYLKTINSFADYKRKPEDLTIWLTGLSEIAFSRRYTNDVIDRFFKNTFSMIKDNILYESGTNNWKVKNSEIVFHHDTVFYVTVSNATLSCRSLKDSTEIYNVTGTYFPDKQLFRGTRGIVTWEKAGFPRADVSAELGKFTIMTDRSSFAVDSAKLTHTTYFKKPEYGTLSDQAISFSNKERANYPRFETYTKQFKIKNLYESVNYEGGLSFEGANVKGKGENLNPAEITLYRNDTLYVRIKSKEFLFSKIGLNSQETAITLYLNKDSIYHSNLGFSFFANSREVNLFRTSNPISKSPYYNSYHSLDMYFEYLTWNMNEPDIILSRARGSALGQALFESSSYFNSDYFLRLLGIDEYHPLNRLVKFAEWYYSETFPVAEFAKWMNRPVESVTGLCIDMANKGFVFYDRVNNEVTIKKKTKDFLESFAKRIDYDVLSILSETSNPVDNAILDLRSFDLTVNGVKEVFLSDSQRVVIYPDRNQLVIGRNRRMQFDGTVECGLFKAFGKEFIFDYNTFMIDLRKIDSLRIAVETDVRDIFGNLVTKEIASLIQLGTAELFIDDPNNKSGLKSLKQYPIINAKTYSYIFYDRIPGLEGIYKPEDFYFKVDPFIYENIDHYSMHDMKLPGEFLGGNILRPMRQILEIQENYSLGFNMEIDEDGIDIYEERAKLFNNLHMSNNGLTGNGTLKHLTSTTLSEEYKLFPDSMLTQAKTFIMEKDTSGTFPVLNSRDVDIRWYTKNDEWIATNAPGKSFNMFDNGTTLDGSVNLRPKVLNGTGIINMTDSRIASNLFDFSSNAIRADTADYNLKSQATSGYSFIAENANTNINFDLKLTTFHLNTDSSVVKFPEIQYFCTMTDFAYNMQTRILNMEQKGKSNTPLLTADNLLRLNYASLDKPTFFATNSISDTVAFSSWKGIYHLDQEYIEAENINYIHIADALIQPDSGKIIIDRRAKIRQLNNAIIALNNKHILHSANINIESTKRYTGNAVYDFIAENRDIQRISFPELSVDTLTTSAKGYIPVSQNFMLSPAFSFSGDVALFARNNNLTFTGIAGISHNCSDIKSYAIKFKSPVDPKNVMIPISDKPRDLNDNLVFSGSYISSDSINIYPTFLSAQRLWTDVGLVTANGFLYYEKVKGRYVISSLEKIADPKLSGNMVAFDNNLCILSSEGNLNFGAKFDLLKLSAAGDVRHSIDSGKVSLNAILALDFHFSPEALKMMADELRMMPTLKPVNLNSEMISKGMKDLLGVTVATEMKGELDLFGTSRSLPKEYTYELLLNDVKLKWNEETSSFRSSGKIGIGFVGPQAINVYADGYVEIQRRRSGDLIDIYLKANASTWYYFSYFRGVMMTQAGNIDYNTLISKIKLNNRKDPQSTTRIPYTYMVASEDRLGRFLRRMAGDSVEEPPATQ